MRGIERDVLNFPVERFCCVFLDIIIRLLVAGAGREGRVRESAKRKTAGNYWEKTDFTKKAEICL